MKVSTTEYLNNKEILATRDNWVAFPASVKIGTGTDVYGDGRSIIQAGTLLTSEDGTALYMEDPNILLVPTTDPAVAQAMCLYEVDVTKSDKPAAALVQGYIEEKALSYTADTVFKDALKQSLPQITIINRLRGEI